MRYDISDIIKFNSQIWKIYDLDNTHSCYYLELLSETFYNHVGQVFPVYFDIIDTKATLIGKSI